MAILLHELLTESAMRNPNAPALRYRDTTLSYDELCELCGSFASGLIEISVQRFDRIAVYADKRIETVAALFGTSMAGAVFVPVNPILKPEQVTHILNDCNVRILVTTVERLPQLDPLLSSCRDLRTVILMGGESTPTAPGHYSVIAWQDVVNTGRDPRRTHRAIDDDMAAILYTSGSTGKPKGVVLCHRNMRCGAESVSSYLNNTADDRILSVLPLSFDAGLSQLTTAFKVGATAVLMNYLFPRDVLQLAARERITGITAVPPIWIQLAQLEWPQSVASTLRYIANTGGHMPRSTLDTLRAKLPKTLPYLMYGLTEAFRSTYLPPAEVDRRPDSIGKAIPNAEIMVVRPDGTPCDPGEPGELVHRGALVSLGYWNDPAKTAERFRPAPGQPAGLTMPEIAVWSGDTVRTDEEGYIYFVARRDEMIKTSGYRVSPTEVEEVIYGSGLVAEAAATGAPHPMLGQAIVVFATSAAGTSLDCADLTEHCRNKLPPFMVPHRFIEYPGALPKNANGKIDRKQLAELAASALEPQTT